MTDDTKRPLKVFLCHAHSDRDAVRGLYARLKREGVDVWLDKEKLLPGADWEYEIRKAVREADVVVVCLSKQFNQAGFRQKEVRIALDAAMEKPEGEIFIIPARLEECDNLESLNKWHWVDLFERDGFQRLILALRIRAERIGAALQQHRRATVSRPKTNAEQEAAREKAEQEAIEKARLDAEELERQRLAKEQADRESAEKLAREKAEQEAIEKARFDAEELDRQKAAKIKADREMIEKVAREKAEQDAIAKARLEAEELERQKTAKEKTDREAARVNAKAARERAEKETAAKARLEAEELERQKAAKASQPKKAKSNTAIIVVLIGLAGIICAALISSPMLQGLFSRTPEPTTTLFFTPTETKTPAPSKTPTKVFTPAATAFPDEITDNGIPMRLVPAGEFEMGEGDQAHPVYLADFYMDKYEVTNALYKACVDAGGCTSPQQTKSYIRSSYYGNSEFDDYPVIYVDWNQAKTYCEWRGPSTSSGQAHLPTEAQWEKAARGTDGRTYPWGSTFDGTKLNFCDKNCSFDWADKTVDDGYADTAPVGSYESGKSPYGIYDLAGNVWEWTADWYSDTYYQTSPSENPLGPDSGTYRVLRGGSWVNFEDYVRSAFRNNLTPDFILSNVGFRCARSLP